MWRGASSSRDERGTAVFRFWNTTGSVRNGVFAHALLQRGGHYTNGTERRQHANADTNRCSAWLRGRDGGGGADREHGARGLHRGSGCRVRRRCAAVSPVLRSPLSLGSACLGL